MTKKQKTWIGILIAIILILVGWRVYYGQRSQGNTIKIGALLSLSGNASAWGQNAQRAIELATDEINQKGGINGERVEVIFEDTAGDPKTALSGYQKLTSLDHVTAIIGPLLQAEVASLAPVVAQGDTPLIAPTYASLQNRPDPRNPLMIWMDASTEASRMADYVYGQGIRTVGIIGTKDNWENEVSDVFARQFKSLGGKVTQEEIVQTDAADMKLPVTEIVATHPQAVFLGTYYQFTNATKSLHDLGYSGKEYSIEVDDYLAGQTYQWTHSLQFIAPDFYASDFIDAFKAKYGEAPGLPAGQSFDAANILFSFLSKSQNQGDILQAMKNFSHYNGVSGQLEITSDNRTLLPTALFEIEATGTIKRVFGLN